MTSAATPVRVLHVTTGLESGGAETLLRQLVARTNPAQFASAVVSLTDEGPVLGEQIRAAGIPLRALGFQRGVPDPRIVPALAREVRRFGPQVVQTWLAHADLAGALAVPRRVPLAWGLHNTLLDAAHAKTQTVMLAWLNARLAGRPARIVCCSEAVRDDYARIGYSPGKMTVIPNGVDTAQFVPSDAARRDVRRELGLGECTPLVGLMARFDPQKDHETFFQAAGLLRRVRPDVRFVLCGTGVTPENASLTRWARENGAESVTYLLGLRRDGPRVTAALDAATCCSRYGKSFGLVLAEAMACGVPVVTTDMAGPVGVVGEAGRVVPVGDAPALAQAWQDILSLTPNEREHAAGALRERVETRFSLRAMVQGYETLYRELTNTLESGALETVPE